MGHRILGHRTHHGRSLDEQRYQDCRYALRAEQGKAEKFSKELWSVKVELTVLKNRMSKAKDCYTEKKDPADLLECLEKALKFKEETAVK